MHEYKEKVWWLVSNVPGVTIGIPVRNEAAFIERTLHSLVGQADEIIISDNASTDGTSEICQKFASDYPEITYVRHDKNEGPKFNWRYPLKRARHKYFLWVGGHDLLPLNYVAKLKHILDTTDAVLAYSDSIHLSSEYVFKRSCEYHFSEELEHANPAIRVLTLIQYLSECSMFHGLYRINVLKDALQNVDHKHYSGFDHGILAEMAFLGTLHHCKDTIYYRLDTREDEPWTVSWERIMRTQHGEHYDPSVHLPDFVGIGIYFVQLNIAKKAAPFSFFPEKYLATVKNILLARWGLSAFVKEYIMRYFK